MFNMTRCVTFMRDLKKLLSPYWNVEKWTNQKRCTLLLFERLWSEKGVDPIGFWNGKWNSKQSFVEDGAYLLFIIDTRNSSYYTLLYMSLNQTKCHMLGFHYDWMRANPLNPAESLPCNVTRNMQKLWVVFVSSFLV